MNTEPQSRAIRPHVALDLHKEYVMTGAMNAAQQWVLRPRKVEMSRFREWAAANLRQGDAVILETTGTSTTSLPRSSRERWSRTPGRFVRLPKRGSRPTRKT